MESKIASAIRAKYPPIGLLWSDDKPEGAVEFAEGRWGCVMALAAAAAKGRFAVASSSTVGCPGGSIGLGFSDRYEHPSGGIEYFLSTGNPDICSTEEGRRLAEINPDVLLGERYVKTPELARKFVEACPKRIIPKPFVVFKPLDRLSPGEQPKVVIFMVNPDQLSALIVLANYDRETSDNVIVPFGAGCHQIGILAYEQAESDQPKAILGLTDLSARKMTDKSLGRDILSFSVPWVRFLEMEANVAGSFLERDTWKEVMEGAG